MKHTLYFLVLMLGISGSTVGQSTHNFSMGAGYANGQYYSLSTDVATTASHSSWDIAFSVFGMTDAAVFINEGASFSSAAPELYIIPNKSFSDNIAVSDLGIKLKNDEKSWDNGSFNSVKIASNWADYGWGAYNLTNHKIEGTALYAIKLSNGTYKKFMVDTLVGGTYYFKYADFDGANLQQKSISKSAFPNQTLAYFSFATNSTVTVEPSTDWDWLFTRYETVVYNSGVPTDYVVGGILLNKGVEAVIADNINPSTVDASNYVTSSDSLTVIGHDWKAYDFTNGWGVDNDRVYFVKTVDSNLYKIQFIDFQGSSTGQGTFLKTFLGKWTSVNHLEANENLISLNTFPNPASNYVNVLYSLIDYEEQINLSLSNMYGQLVLEKTISGKEGLNALEVELNDFSKGVYVLMLETKTGSISKKIIIQ